MAKFFLSNSSASVQKNININNPIFIDYKEYHNDFVNCVTYRKLSNFQYANYYISIDREGGIFSAGTFIYKGISGTSALKLIYEDLRVLSIAELKKQIIGYYNIVIFNNSTVIIFNDYYGIYDIHYSTRGNDYFISSQLKDIVDQLNELEIDEFPFIMECFQTGSFPGDTIYKNVKKLKGNEYISITGHNFEVVQIPVQEYIETYKFISEDKAIADIVSMIEKYAYQISQAFGNIRVFLTGGLDSRLNFAAYKKVAPNLETQYWISKGTCKEDRDLVKQISEFYGIKYNIENCINPEDNNGFDKTYQDQVYNLLGFNNFVGYGGKNFIDSISLHAKNQEFFAFGYFCEAIRLREWAEKLNKDAFSLYEYVDDYYICKSLNSNIYPNIEYYRDYLLSHYKKQLIELGFSGDFSEIPLDLFESFRWKLSKFCDSRWECIVNNFTYSFALLSIPKIHEAILSIPASIIKDGSFQIKVIKQIDETLISKFDVFSHRRSFYIDKHNRKKRKFTIKNAADKIFDVLPVLRKPLTFLYKKKVYNEPLDNLSDNKICQDILSKYKLSFDLNIENIKFENIKRTRQMLFAMKCARKE